MNHGVRLVSVICRSYWCVWSPRLNRAQRLNDIQPGRTNRGQKATE